MKLGFKSVTMDDISKDLGISKKTVYKHYPNKKELIKACILKHKDEIKLEFEKIKGENYNPVEELFKIEEFFGKDFLESGLSPSFQLKKYYPDLFKEVHDDMDCHFEDFMFVNFNKGINLGFYRKELDFKIVRGFHHTLLMSINDESFQEEKRLHYEILNYHIRAIGTPKGVEELQKQLNKLKENE